MAVEAAVAEVAAIVLRWREKKKILRQKKNIKKKREKLAELSTAVFVLVFSVSLK